MPTAHTSTAVRHPWRRWPSARRSPGKKQRGGGVVDFKDEAPEFSWGFHTHRIHGAGIYANMTGVYSWFTHKKWWFSIVMLNYQRVSDITWLVISNMNFIFHNKKGMSSFPLTNSYFSRWLLHHEPDMVLPWKLSFYTCLYMSLYDFCGGPY